MNGTTVEIKISTPKRRLVSFSTLSLAMSPGRISTPAAFNLFVSGLSTDSGRTMPATRFFGRVNQKRYDFGGLTKLPVARTPFTMSPPVRPVTPMMSTRGLAEDICSDLDVSDLDWGLDWNFYLIFIFFIYIDLSARR